MRKISLIFYLFTLILFAGSCFAADIFATEPPHTISSVSGNLYDIASILSRVMWAACIVAGIVLSIYSFTQFQVHKKNPKLVPLSNPTVFLILALCCFMIPFASKIFGGKEGSDKGDPQQKAYSRIDKPKSNARDIYKRKREQETKKSAREVYKQKRQN